MAAALALVLPTTFAQRPSRLPDVEIAPEIRALIAIKAKMERSLAEVPNYVCSETVSRIRVNEKQRGNLEKLISDAAGEREHVRATALAELADTVRVDVAVVDGEEIYSWPGQEFQAVPLAEMVGFGLMATGSFSSLAKSIFVAEQGVIRYAGREALEGELALRYNYRVSLFRSGYSIGTPSGEAKTAYEGSFWAAAGDHRLLRLTRKAVDIPPELGLATASTRIDYADVEIDGAGFTLPRYAVDELFYRDGTLSRNEITFEQCRKFGAETTLSFDVVEEPPEPEPRRQSVSLPVPVGIELHAELMTEIRSETAQVGDPVQARLRRKVDAESRTVLEEGDLLLGRVRRLQRLGRAGDPYFAVAIEFTELQSAGGASPVKMTLIDLPGAENASRHDEAEPRVRTSRRRYGLDGLSGTVETTVSEWTVDPGVEGLDTFYVRGERLRLRKGLRMVLRVVEDD